MSEQIMISGVPASGKTTGARFLPPSKTVYIDCDGKGLGWPGWKKEYSTEKGNYFKLSNVADVYKYVKAVHDKKPEVEYIVIDTISTLMSNAEMDILKNPSRDQWADLAVDVYDLFRLIRELPREDLIIYTMSHIEPYDVNGTTQWRIKTNGRKLTKLNLNAFLKNNLYTKVEYVPGQAPEYKLITVNDGTTEARSTMGAFEPVIENNLLEVANRIKEVESNG